MTAKAGRWGPFLGCSLYPHCSYTQDAPTNDAQSTTPSAEPTPSQPAPMIAPTTPEPTTHAEPTAPAPHRAGTLESIISAIAADAARNSVNEERVNEIVAAALEQNADAVVTNFTRFMELEAAELRREFAQALAGISTSGVGAQTIAVTVNDTPAVSVEGIAHEALREVLTLIVAGFNVYLVGPAGSGKTTVGEQCAAALNRRFASISCAPGLPESALIGRMIPNLTDGTERYRAVPFVECYRDGGVFLADEIDNADASTLLVLNSALANGHMTLPNGERIERHPDFAFIVSANTYGHGQTREYVGRTQLDAAFLDRFAGATVELDYDRNLEAAICPDAEVRESVWRMRDRSRGLKLRRVVSTRAIVHGYKLRARCGYSLRDVMERLTRGWSAEDRTAVGAA